MTLWNVLFIVLAAGATGGFVNALMSDNGFVFPKTTEYGGRKILRPGFIGNIIVGGLGAAISWGLYGPFAASNILGTTSGETVMEPSLTLSSLVGAALVGVAGARWLTNEVDKNLLRAAASEASAAVPASKIAGKFLTEKPATAWKIAAEEFGTARPGKGSNPDA